MVVLMWAGIDLGEQSAAKGLSGVALRALAQKRDLDRF